MNKTTRFALTAMVGLLLLPSCSKSMVDEEIQFLNENDCSIFTDSNTFRGFSGVVDLHTSFLPSDLNDGGFNSVVLNMEGLSNSDASSIINDFYPYFKNTKLEILIFNAYEYTFLDSTPFAKTEGNYYAAYCKIFYNFDAFSFLYDVNELDVTSKIDCDSNETEFNALNIIQRNVKSYLDAN